MKIFNFSFEVFINFMEVALFFYFIFHRFKIKDKYVNVSKSLVGIGIVFLTASATFINIVQIDETLSVLYFWMCQVLFVFLFMSGNLVVKFFGGSAFILFDIAADTLTFYITGAITSSTAAKLMEYPQRYLLTSIFILLLAAATLIFSRKETYNLILPKWIMVIFIFSIILAVGFVEYMISFFIETNHNIAYVAIAAILSTITIIILIIMYTGKTAVEYEKVYQKEKKIPYIFKWNGVSHEVNVKNVRYFNSDRRLVDLNMTNNKQYEFYGKLDTVFNEVSDLYPHFIRINKSSVVNELFIDERTDKSVFIDGIEFRISDKYYSGK